MISITLEDTLLGPRFIVRRNGVRALNTHSYKRAVEYAQSYLDPHDCVNPSHVHHKDGNPRNNDLDNLEIRQ